MIDVNMDLLNSGRPIDKVGWWKDIFDTLPPIECIGIDDTGNALVFYHYASGKRAGRTDADNRTYVFTGTENPNLSESKYRDVKSFTHYYYVYDNEDIDSITTHTAAIPDSLVSNCYIKYLETVENIMRVPSDLKLHWEEE